MSPHLTTCSLCWKSSPRPPANLHNASYETPPPPDLLCQFAPASSIAQSGDPPLGNSVRGLITLHHTLLVYLLTSLPVRTMSLSRSGILSQQDVTLGTKVGAHHHAWYIAAAQKYSSIPNTTLNLVTFQYSQWLLKISLRNFCYKLKQRKKKACWNKSELGFNEETLIWKLILAFITCSFCTKHCAKDTISDDFPFLTNSNPMG